MRGVEQAYWARQGRLLSRCRRSTTTRRCRAAARRQVDTFRAAPRHLRDSTLTNHQGDFAAAPSLVPFEPEADVDDEFTVFDGFGRDNKPVRSDGQKPASSGAGLSWDEERQVWEKANRSMFGRPMANLSERISGASVSEGCHPLQPALLRDLSRASGASPWDLRTMSSFKSPDSLNRFRSQAPPQLPPQPHSPLQPPPPLLQAEDLFNKNVSSSLFTSPTMTRFKRQTDEMLSDFSATLSSVSSTITQSLWSLFG